MEWEGGNSLLENWVGAGRHLADGSGIIPLIGKCLFFISRYSVNDKTATIDSCSDNRFAHFDSIDTIAVFFSKDLVLLIQTDHKMSRDWREKKK